MATGGNAVIAHLFTYLRPAGPESDEMRTFLEAAMPEARAFDGCEGVVAMRDPLTGSRSQSPACRAGEATDLTVAQPVVHEGQQFAVRRTRLTEHAPTQEGSGTRSRFNASRCALLVVIRPRDGRSTTESAQRRPERALR